LILLVGTSDL